MQNAITCNELLSYPPLLVSSAILLLHPSESDKHQDVIKGSELIPV